jgi:hypothetical protein
MPYTKSLYSAQNHWKCYLLLLIYIRLILNQPTNSLVAKSDDEESLPFDTILRNFNPPVILTTYFRKIDFNIILSSPSRFSDNDRAV